MKKITSTVSVMLFMLSISSAVSAANENKLQLEDIRLLSEAFGRFQTNFVDEVGAEELIENCISGMVSGVDADSEYLDKSKFRELRDGNKKSQASIGVTLTIRNNYPVVISPIEDTPSYFAGVKSGDVILQVNENLMHGATLAHAISVLQGRQGEKVKLKVSRDGNKAPIVIDIKREHIRIISVKNKLLDNNVGYIRITSFLSNTGKLFKQSITSLKMQSNNNLRGLIVDLRNNPGGLLSSAIVVADTFLTKGLIAYTESRRSELKLEAKNNVLLEGVPLVILVNHGSAAASEVITGALRDHSRATIIGEKTFGRASIQTVMPLANGGAIKLTSSRWRTPNGDSIHGVGITPDITVKGDYSDSKDNQLLRAISHLQR